MSAGVQRVQPANIATFYAAQWDGTLEDPNLIWVATRADARLGKIIDTVRGPRLTLTNRRGKAFRLSKGEWLLALGSGVILTCSDKQYRENYQPAPPTK